MGYQTKGDLSHVGGSVLIDTILGTTTDAKGNEINATTARIYGPSTPIQGELAPHLVKRFEDEDPYLLSVLDQTDDEGNVVGEPDEVAQAQAEAEALRAALEAERAQAEELRKQLAERGQAGDEAAAAERAATEAAEQQEQEKEGGDGELKGEALENRVKELGIVGASSLNAEEKRQAVAELTANGEPFNPKEYNQDDVLAHLAEADDDERARVIEAEKHGKNRDKITGYEPPAPEGQGQGG